MANTVAPLIGIGVIEASPPTQLAVWAFSRGGFTIAWRTPSGDDVTDLPILAARVVWE